MKNNSTNRRGALQAPLPGITQDHLEKIKILHRHPGFITIEQLPKGGGCKRMYAGKPADLNISAPLSAPLVDVYMPINGLKSGWRKGTNVGYLNSIFADVDYHLDPNPAGKTEDEIGRFMKYARGGALPLPSMVVRSGRGAWFHYLLREDGSDRSVPNVFPALELWQRLQERFADLLTENGFVGDPQARDVSHLIRLPGSVNSKAGGKVVFYTVTHGADGKVVMYTMADLAREMHLPTATPTAAPVSQYHGYTQAPPAAQSSRPAHTGVKVPNRRAGRDGLIARRERRFWLVVGMRGGIIRDGSRGAFAFVLNSLLYGDRDRGEKVLDFCKETCRPALTDGRIVSLLKKEAPYLLTDGRGAKGGPGIWERLSLTQAEKVRLDIDHDRNPLMRSNKGQAIARLRRRHDIVRGALACYTTNGNKPAPAAQIVTKIRATCPKYSRRTLLRDLTEMRQSGSLTL